MKTFIRYAPGAGGTYVALIAYALRNDLEANFKGGNAHDYRRLYSETNNYDKLAHGTCLDRDPNSFELFQYYTEEEFHTAHPNSTDGIQWFKDNLVFNNDSYHYICTHARNLNSLMRAVDNSNVINVTMSNDDVDQLCYNFVTKAVITEPTWAYERAGDIIDDLTYWYPNKIVTFDQLNDAVKNKDVKFLTWLVKYAWKNYWEKYPQYTPPGDFKVFNVSWQEVNTTQLINRIGELANFLEVNLTTERKNSVIKLIQNWAGNQQPVTFKLSLDDF